MAPTILLGPQRFQTTAGAALASLGVDGPVATINAGWEEREGQDHELNDVLGGNTRNLRLHHRMYDVLQNDHAFAAAALDFRDRHDELIGFYRVRLAEAMAGLRTLQRRTTWFGIGAHAIDDAIEGIRHIDKWYATELNQLYAAFETRAPRDHSEAIAWHRGELAAVLSECAAVVITGGHVGELMRCLRIFTLPIPDTMPVIAWSAGAMALTDRVLLFHDHAPHGTGEPEVHGRGLGRLSRLILLPYARRRLLLDDEFRCSVLARRFPHDRLVLLDEGDRLDLDDSQALPAGARVLGVDGRVEVVA